jgi:hypothetical protein
MHCSPDLERNRWSDRPVIRLAQWFQSAVDYIVLEVVHSQVAADHSYLVVRTLLVVDHRQVAADRMHPAVHRNHQPAHIERSAGRTGWVDCSDHLHLGTRKASVLAIQTRLMPEDLRVFRSIVLYLCQKKGIDLNVHSLRLTMEFR